MFWYHDLSWQLHACVFLAQVASLLLDHVDAKSAYEALLLAIKLGHDEIAEMILEHPKYDEINTELRSVSRALERKQLLALKVGVYPNFIDWEKNWKILSHSVKARVLLYRKHWVDYTQLKPWLCFTGNTEMMTILS